MRKMLLFFSHKLTDRQVDDAKKSWEVEEFIYLPKNLQELFSNVPPELDSLKDYVKPLVKFLKENVKKGDISLIQGDFGLVNILVREAKKEGAVAVYSTTKREVLEKKIDGKPVKISKFEHIKYRRYE